MKIAITGAVLLAAATLLLGGCGLKGPLYLPGEDAGATSAPTEPAAPDTTQEPGAASGK